MHQYIIHIIEDNEIPRLPYKHVYLYMCVGMYILMCGIKSTTEQYC